LNSISVSMGWTVLTHVCVCVCVCVCVYEEGYTAHKFEFQKGNFF